MIISIITPVLNEEQQIVQFLDTLSGQEGIEHILVDGGSTDRTCQLIEEYPAMLLSSAPGRGTQQNTGAARATGDILLFLHCDTRLPELFQRDIQLILNKPDTAAGAFCLAIDHPDRAYRFIEQGANLRSRLLHLPYGDQGLFMKKNIFERIGGFPNQPILEEIPLLRSLRKLGKIRIASSPAITSARRWQRLGILRTTLINQAILIKMYMGYAPSHLARLYSGDSD